MPLPLRRRALAGEIEEELQAHLAFRAADNRRAGMSPADAAADARARFGDVERVKAACLWAAEAHPLRVARRLLLTGLLLAVGLGAFATALSLAWAVFVRPLRFDDADRLVRTGAGWEDARVPFGVFEAWRDRSASFAALTTFNASEFTLAGAPEPVRTMFVSADYFTVFGVAPLAGRGLDPEGREEVLISEALWTRRFERSRAALGATLVLDGEPHTVAGVMPEAAQLSHRVDLWHRLPADWQTAEARHYVVGRLRTGVTLGDVRAEVAALGGGAGIPVLYPLKRVYADPVRSTTWAALSLSLLALLAVTGLTLRAATVRARRSARYGGRTEEPAALLGVAAAAAVAGLAVAR
ncbi:MAG: ABC transporter permease, partial [Rhodothermales bacterium]|nr:ABC transporter permease [Rhodothermales bacterium]